MEIGLSVGLFYSSVNLEFSFFVNCILYEYLRFYLFMKLNNDLCILKRLG